MGLVILGWMPVLSGEAEGYLKERSIYDLQIFTARYGLEPGEKQESIRLDYKYIENYLMKEQVKVNDKAEINSYYINETDELQRKPILAITVSDYNKLRVMSGETPVTLPDDSFALQWEKKVSRVIWMNLTGNIQYCRLEKLNLISYIMVISKFLLEWGYLQGM